MSTASERQLRPAAPLQVSVRQVGLTGTVHQLAHLLVAMPSGRAGWSGASSPINRAIMSECVPIACGRVQVQDERVGASSTYRQSSEVDPLASGDRPLFSDCAIRRLTELLASVGNFASRALLAWETARNFPASRRVRKFTYYPRSH